MTKPAVVNIDPRKNEMAEKRLRYITVSARQFWRPPERRTLYVHRVKTIVTMVIVHCDYGGDRLCLQAQKHKAGQEDNGRWKKRIVNRCC